MKQQNKSNDKLIIIALYTLALQKQKEVNRYTKQLEEYLKEKYKLKDENKWDFSSIICECIYGSECNSDEFIKSLNEHAIKK
jgi:hypothetical protein